jgi:hypothetical protein
VEDLHPALPSPLASTLGLSLSIKDGLPCDDEDEVVSWLRAPVRPPAAVLVSLRSGVAGSAVAEVAEARSSATADVLGDALELVITLLAAAEDTTLGLELVHGHGWQSGALVVCSSVVVNLVDGDGGVDDVGLDDLLVDNGLDGLVDVLEECKNMSRHR